MNDEADRRGTIMSVMTATLSSPAVEDSLVEMGVVDRTVIAGRVTPPSLSAAETW
jgi:hypothetical protein